MSIDTGDHGPLATPNSGIFTQAIGATIQEDDEKTRSGLQLPLCGTKLDATPGLERASPRFSSSSGSSNKFGCERRSIFSARIILIVGSLLLWLSVTMLYKNYILVAAAGLVDAGLLNRQAASSSTAASVASSSPIPDYLVTSPELLPGPTPTGPAAFLAQTNPAPFTGTTYIPNTPLETQVPIVGQPSGPTDTGDNNIYHLMGQLSHYFPNPSGFGVKEYSIPPNASIIQLHMLSRHGSRYPTTGAGALVLGQKIVNYTSAPNFAHFTGPLAFLNTWKSQLGAEILVPVGKQELFDSGTLHQIEYGHLYPNDGSKIIARTTTQDRMLKSAEYFMAGFFGLTWTQNATLVLARENSTGVFNNSLAGYQDCANANSYVNAGGNNATAHWYSIYLANATSRLNSYSPGYNWSVGDTYNAQSLCAYETVALGYSAFCGLFTYEEWEGYEYSVDLSFAGGSMFQSPVGRATGIGYVEEVLARLQHHVITQPIAQVNITLDNNTATFPLNQSLYFDFSHDTNIASILTAFGLDQFSQTLDLNSITPNRSLIVSHMEPFGARLDMEIIQAPAPLSGDRSAGPVYLAGNATKYIHFILNQRTIPLARSATYAACGQRDDGWCELSTFINILSTLFAVAEYDYSCNGKYPSQPWGAITNGVALNATTVVSVSSAAATATATTTSAKGPASTTGATPSIPSYLAPYGSAPCPTNGVLVCNGPTEFGLCNWGHVVWQNVAAGTVCKNGTIVGSGNYAVYHP